MTDATGTQDRGAGVNLRTAGRATPEGTARFAARFPKQKEAGHFREARGLRLASIGIGTYLGEPTASDDEAYAGAVAAAVGAGCNVIDTAVNYRFQRSERSIGTALAASLFRGVKRDELVIATKGGFLPFDGSYPADVGAWFAGALSQPGIATPDDVVAGCHVMTPRYLESQIEWSRRNLGLATLDIYYLHNPETQLQEVERPEFLKRIRDAFALLERKADEGAIGVYGVATWDGLRVPPESPGHLSLAELLEAAREVGGEGHRFGAVQLPVNLVMGEACLAPTQRSRAGRPVPLLAAAKEAGLTVMASGSLLQGRLIEALSPAFAARLPGTRTNAQRGLQVVRSVGGLATALVGMKQTAHVAENLALGILPPLPAGEAEAILRDCRRESP